MNSIYWKMMSNVRISHTHKHAFLQMLFMHIYIGDFTFKMIVVKVVMSNKSQCKYA
jgi:hypothetical protein